MSTRIRNGRRIHPSQQGSRPPGRGGIRNGVGRLTLLILLAATLMACGRRDSADADEAYMCPPCHVHDDLFFEEAGACPVCGMALIERSDSSEVGEAHIHPGSGNFLMEGGPGRADKLVQVFYHMPERFTSGSPILVLVPGAGRDAEDADEWIFDDFDRLFERVAGVVGSEREEFDVFGHSAGGQILRRLVLFDRRSRAGRIFAANSGFYTMPDTATTLPFGVADAPVTMEGLKEALGRPLVLLLGEEDDADEAGGTLLRSPTVDRQGLHRLARGRYVHRAGEALANRLGTDFAWELRVVPGIGHDFRRMSAAAADFLYGDEEGL